MVPLVITALAAYFLFARVGLAGTFTGMILAHTVLAVPFVVITVTATLVGFDNSLIRASASLGASPPTTFFKVIVPLILPGVISGALFAFITSLDEVIVALFISGGENATLTRRMFNSLRDQIDPTIAAISTCLIVVSISLLMIGQYFGQQKERRQQP